MKRRAHSRQTEAVRHSHSQRKQKGKRKDTMPATSRLHRLRRHDFESLRLFDLLRLIAFVAGSITLAAGAYGSQVSMMSSPDMKITKSIAAAPSETRFAKDQIRHFEILLG